MKTTRHRPTPCPICGHKLDASSCPEDGRAPVPGDLAVCIECFTVLTFREGLKLEVPSFAEVAEYMRQNPERWEHMQDFRMRMARERDLQGDSRN